MSNIHDYWQIALRKAASEHLKIVEEATYILDNEYDDGLYLSSALENSARDLIALALRAKDALPLVMAAHEETLRGALSRMQRIDVLKGEKSTAADEFERIAAEKRLKRQREIEESTRIELGDLHNKLQHPRFRSAVQGLLDSMPVSDTPENAL